jgi:phenylalanyl-tRNA synthetase alpha chain
MEEDLAHQRSKIISLIIEASSIKDLNDLYIQQMGKKGEFTLLIKNLTNIPQADRPRIGALINETKKMIEEAFTDKKSQLTDDNSLLKTDIFDETLPGIRPEMGHLHPVTQAIMEITRIFERIGFTRVRYPEVDWDWYAFESLNMPGNHPARDEWETFHIKSQTTKVKSKIHNDKLNNIVLTPHTSNGQVREMEKGKLPIRMVNIAKCYRRQIDISHTPMFHQFEGLYIDRDVSIAHLKGVCDYFFKSFYGLNRISRLRPFHFQFTEPSFEIDVSCGICNGTGKLKNNTDCKLCKEGWLELGGAGMVHPNVLKNGGIDPHIYNGFAFGWGVERTYMMKSGTCLDDIRNVYSNDIRFLEQF